MANIRSARLINSDFNPGNETIGRSEFGAESGLHSDQDNSQETDQGNRIENQQEDYGFRRAVEEFDELFTSYNQARSTHAGEIFPSFLSEIPRPISRPTPQLQEFRPTLPLEEFTAPPPPAQVTTLENAYFARIKAGTDRSHMEDAHYMEQSAHHTHHQNWKLSQLYVQ